MLAATLLALGAAVLHAGWNLAIKQSGDRFLALWSQFLVAAIGCAVLVAVLGLPARGWIWAGISGIVHVPYCWFLARAYDRGDFSMVYPIARGGGAALAAVGGVVLLGDHLTAGAVAGIVIVVGGLVGLAGRSRSGARRDALVVAVAISVYSVNDAHGIRSTGSQVYALATFVAIGVTVSASGVIAGRGPAFVAHLRSNGRRSILPAIATVVTYSMVQLAFQRAAVGYVTALRESSVVLAALIGWRYLGESPDQGRRRLVCAGIVLAGLVVLVVGR